MNAFQYPTAPLLMGFILGPLIEQHFRRALLFSRGDYTTFIDRPISAAFLVACVLLLLVMAVPAIKRWSARGAAQGGTGAE